MLARAFSPAIRRATVALWLAGAVISGGTALVAATHRGARYGLVFAAVAIALVMLAVAASRAMPWALVVSGVLLGVQLFGAVGSGWELLHGVDGGKAHELRELGVDPTFGVALNLTYSVVAFAVFLCAMRHLGERTPPTPHPA